MGWYLTTTIILISRLAMTAAAAHASLLKARLVIWRHSEHRCWIGDIRSTTR
jgi:hypothetical protein